MNNSEFDTLEPKVPEIIKAQATLVERYLLDQCSIQEQQNKLIWSTLASVEEQTKITNGRVTKLEDKAADTEEVIKVYRRARRWAIGGISAVAAAGYALLDRLIEKYF